MTISPDALPEISEEARPFWEACREHRLLVQKCKDCGKHQFYPRRLCKECWSVNLEWVPSSGKGKLYTYTIVHRAPYKGLEIPYTVAIVDMEEGVRLITNLVEYSPDRIKIGDAVRVVFQDINQEVSLPKFKPV